MLPLQYISGNWECFKWQHQFAMLKTDPWFLLLPVAVACDSGHNSERKKEKCDFRCNSGKMLRAKCNDQEVEDFTVEILTGMLWFKSGSFRFRKSWPACFGGDPRGTDPYSVASDDWESLHTLFVFQPIVSPPLQSVIPIVRTCTCNFPPFVTRCPFGDREWQGESPMATMATPCYWPYSTRRASLDKHYSISHPIFTVTLIY